MTRALGPQPNYATLEWTVLGPSAEVLELPLKGLESEDGR